MMDMVDMDHLEDLSRTFVVFGDILSLFLDN